VLHRFDRLIAQPHGIVLVTGPTGSGKTTTLYAALSPLDATRTNIMTVEDPIEYELPGVGQTQVNSQDRPDLCQGPARHPAPGPGRHHDRRDPRLRDRADRHPGLADRPPGAGHAAHQRRPSAVTRLTDMGVEPFLLSSSACWACWRSAWCASCAQRQGRARAAARAGAGAAGGDCRWPEAGGRQGRRPLRGGACSTARTLAIWTRQLAGLVGSGLPLERSLTALADEAEDPRQRSC
jgi:general secretion pathway protein E